LAQQALKLLSVVLPLLWHTLQGAATSVYLCSTKGIKGGEYYVDCNIAPSSVAAHDAALGAKLWEYSEQLVAAAVPGIMQQ
jgi:hypothetical protein